MDGSIRLWIYLLAQVGLVLGQGQQCYFGAGAAYRAPSSVIPCNDNGPSACCMQGDTCLSGNACYNYATGNVYQYGCTDITYTDGTCPSKCGWDPDESPWTALEYCDADGVSDTWNCHSPESCGCKWNATYELQVLPLRGCEAMGKDARVALYAPSALAPWVSLPKTPGGTTNYYKTTTSNGTLTWISTAVKDYTPTSIGPYVTYDKAAPTEAVAIFPGVKPEPSTLGWAHLPSETPPPVSISALPSSSSSSPSSSSSSSTSQSTTSRTPAASSTSSTSSTTSSTSSSSSSPTAAASSSLSTGAKAGIGVGVAGGVCLLAAVAIFSIIFRRRRNQKRVSTGSGPDEKYASWQGQPYPPGGSPHGYHYNQSYQYQGVPAMIHEATYSNEDEQTIHKRLSPPQPLAEMEGGHVFPEADSRSPSRSRPNDGK